jgi:hypothetical protein
MDWSAGGSTDMAAVIALSCRNRTRRLSCYLTTPIIRPWVYHIGSLQGLAYMLNSCPDCIRSHTSKHVTDSRSRGRHSRHGGSDLRDQFIWSRSSWSNHRVVRWSLRWVETGLTSEQVAVEYWHNAHWWTDLISSIPSHRRLLRVITDA